jgi:hypothetical protein
MFLEHNDAAKQQFVAGASFSDRRDPASVGCASQTQPSPPQCRHVGVVAHPVVSRGEPFLAGAMIGRVGQGAWQDFGVATNVELLALQRFSSRADKPFQMRKLHFLELNKEEKATLDRAVNGRGGFEDFLRRLQKQVNHATRTITVSDEDLENIPRFAFDYKQGGWETRLTTIFGRVLGPKLGRDD